MTNMNIQLTKKQFQAVISQFANNKIVIQTIHPADNMLFLTLENDVSIKIHGHWKYQSENEKLASYLIQNESLEDNFNKIENLAEQLSVIKPKIKTIIVKDKISIEFYDNSSITISEYLTSNNENELLSLDYSSSDDTTHFRYTYANGKWKQSILMQK